jgi:hypothetical protein
LLTAFLPSDIASLKSQSPSIFDRPSSSDKATPSLIGLA